MTHIETLLLLLALAIGCLTAPVLISTKPLISRALVALALVLAIIVGVLAVVSW